MYWKQVTSATHPKPAIQLTKFDPSYDQYRLHINDLFKRYSSPIIVLNLIKEQEKKPRESILGPEFEEAVKYHNKFLPPGLQVLYKKYDYAAQMKRLKDPKQVYNGLDSIAIEALRNTGIFAMRVTQKLQFPIGDNYTNNNSSNSIDFPQSLSTPMGNDGTFSCLSDDWSDTYSVDNDGIYIIIIIYSSSFLQ